MDKTRARLGAEIVNELAEEIKEGKYEGWGMEAGYATAIYWWLQNIAIGTYEK